MPKIKLKPCPFCGSAAKIRIEVVRGVTNDYIRYSVYCPECQIKKYRDLSSGSSDDAGDAVIDKVIEDWNKRNGTDNNALKLEYEGDGYDDEGELVYDTAYCPICHHEYEVDYDDHDNYCRNCGQKLDWEETENETD